MTYDAHGEPLPPHPNCRCQLKTGLPLIECFGGPLDGARAVCDALAFAWPHGWYYLLRTSPPRYRWDPECAAFTNTDAERHRLSPVQIVE